MEKVWQRESLLKSGRLSFTILVTALVFNILFGFVRNPIRVENTLSWIGYDYPFAFIVWGILTGAAYFLNLLQIYDKFGYSGKIGTVSLYAAPFMAVVVVLINDWGWEGKVHLAGALAFITLNAVSLMAFLIKNFKNHICYKATLFIVAAILLGMIITYFAVDKSGLLELVPMWVGLVMLFLINHTKLYPAGEKAKKTDEERDKKKAAKLALCFGMFGADDFYLGRRPQGFGHLLMTYVGAVICIVRFTGMGSVNDIKGESAAIFLAVGLSALGGSAAWAICGAAALKKEI